ncbi:hypothetical protein JFL43_04385 [Viridibacillus sp. YIM B01967]|uniref:Uncharacterized protein n=1 Tax=Viridibacillus soli TaxID=2798301 RepID=A0ABS1H487_9BACL|nr:hypothetical protein [Viridibacillus soli]MBK3494106.1 hypothetical protein [Viridibacillus soli]
MNSIDTPLRLLEFYLSYRSPSINIIHGQFIVWGTFWWLWGTRNRNEEEIQVFIKEGLLKYFVKPEGKRGEWIISTVAMEKWYGEEPIEK